MGRQTCAQTRLEIALITPEKERRKRDSHVERREEYFLRPIREGAEVLLGPRSAFSAEGQGWKSVAA